MNISEWIFKEFPNSAYFWFVGISISLGLLYGIFMFLGLKKQEQALATSAYSKTKLSNLITAFVVILFLVIIGYFFIPIVSKMIWDYGKI